MNKHIKRALAVSAAAPFAFIATVGSAGAAITQGEAEKVGNQVFASCAHPGVDEAGFTVRVDLEGDGTGRDADDIERVVITAVDNQGVGDFFNATAHVKKMKVDYFGPFDEFDFFSGGVKAKETVSSDSKSVRDGRKTFSKDKDNVEGIRVTVTWSKIGVPADNEKLVCYVPVGALSGDENY